jgi:hypothetical protein
MFKVISLISLFSQTLSQPVNDDIKPIYNHPIGGDNDANGCLIGAGYSWCESTQSCIRQWITPCEDNLSDCSDCLSKQQKGVNIACPTECNSFQVINPFLPPPPPPPTILPITMQLPNDAQMMPPTPIPMMPEPPISAPMPPPMPPHPMDPLPCPEVMCMMYCENGFQLDENGCNMCSCLSPVPMSPYEIRGILNQEIDTPGECPIPYTTCNNNYVCPKVTEITHCSQDGISGYTTYQLSLIIINPAVQNIYAIYGNDQPIDHPMNIPPAYQGTSIFNSNLGGIAPEIIAINSDAMYDSWLTIGLTDGDSRNKLSVVGIDFDSWSETTGIYTTNGAVFVMDPQEVIVQGEEYIVAQLTIPNDVITTVVMNAQGKLKCDKCTQSQTWSEKQIVFHLERPQVVNPDVIPPNCLTWFDGCNTCSVSNGNLGACTRMMCFREDNPHCLSFDVTGH